MSQAKQAAPERRPSSVIYQREKKTKASVLVTDALARYGISIGGMLVIIAVFTIMAFLLYVSFPLLDGGSVTGTKSYQLQTTETPFVETQMDEQQTIAVDVELSGHVEAFHVGTGTTLQAPSFDLAGATATTFASTLRGDDVLFAFADGTVRTGRLLIKPEVVTAEQIPSNLKKLDARDLTDGTVVYSRIPGQFRRKIVELSLEPAVQVADAGVAILKADYRSGGTAERPLKTFVTLDATGKLRLSQAYSEMNMMTGESTTQLSNAVIPLSVPAESVIKLLLNTPGDRVLVALRDGTLYRYNTRDFANPKLAETIKTLSGSSQLSAVTYLNGENSVVIGGSDGSVAIWFGVDRKSKDTSDGIVWTKVHADFERQAAAITDIRVSQRTRMFTTADAKGSVWIRHGTTERTL